MTTTDLIPVVVDVKTRMVGCVLIQAAGGGDTGLVKRLFDPAGWFLAPTPDTAIVRGTLAQWKAFKVEYDARLRS